MNNLNKAMKVFIAFILAAHSNSVNAMNLSNKSSIKSNAHTYAMDCNDPDCDSDSEDED